MSQLRDLLQALRQCLFHHQVNQQDVLGAHHHVHEVLVDVGYVNHSHVMTSGVEFVNTACTSKARQVDLYDLVH